MPWIEQTGVLTRSRVEQLIVETIEAARDRVTSDLNRVLLLPPDVTRMHSGSGWIAECFYQRLTEAGAEVHLMPTLGQHEPHTPAQNKQMFGSVPQDRIHVHDWRQNITHLGSIDAETVRSASEGRADWEIPIWLNRLLIESKWDLIINIGQRLYVGFI